MSASLAFSITEVISINTLKLLFQDAIKNLKQAKWFLLVIVLYLLYFAIFHADEPNCLIKRTLGIPCPGCGMTRATYYFITLQWKEAYFYHPLVFIMPLIVMVGLFNGVGIFHKLFHSKLYWIVVIGLFLVVYAVRMYLYFPDTPPMDWYPIY